MSTKELEVALSKPIVEINSAGQSKIVWTALASIVIALTSSIVPIEEGTRNAINSTLTVGGPLLVMYFRMFGMGKSVRSAFTNNGAIKLMMSDGSTRDVIKP
jgi:hypothetical protein